ncbi:MAG: hypothetical protein EOO88_43530, partial [Pedobacter sp.]
AHPAARYFGLGKIGQDQVADLAERKRMPLPEWRRLAGCILRPNSRYDWLFDFKIICLSSVVPRNCVAGLIPALPVIFQLTALTLTQIGESVVPVFTFIAFSVVLKITNPFAGRMMAFCCVVVILGTRNPLLVLLTSSMALVSGLLPVSLMAMF